jgi:hypothetical protein
LSPWKAAHFVYGGPCMKEVAVMTRTDHKACRGTMFPDTLKATAGRTFAGKVFSFVIVNPPGLCRAERRVEVNRAEWDGCTQCPEFEPCYKLCMARLALESAVAQF